MTAALQPGVLRYPGGTNSNIWNTKTGEFVSPLPAATRYSRYKDFAPWISGQPEGTFSGAEFLKGLGGKAKRVLWDLNDGMQATFIGMGAEFGGSPALVATASGASATGLVCDSKRSGCTDDLCTIVDCDAHGACVSGEPVRDLHRAVGLSCF